MKHLPTRTCIGCGAKRDKSEFIRIVKNNNKIEVDKTGKSEGRGAYICDSTDCLSKAYKFKKIEKTFKMKINDEIYERLKGIIIGK